MNKRFVCWAHAVVLTTACSSREHNGSRIASNEHLRAQLLALRDADQDAVRAAYGEPHALDSTENFLDRAHRLKEIIRQHGWPTVSMVGEDGARAAWVVIQHADDDVAFQKSSLALMESAARAGEAEWRLVACLTDRVLINSMQRQLYGTQGNGGAGSSKEKAVIDERRKSIGLPTLDEYKARFVAGPAETLCRP